MTAEEWATCDDPEAMLSYTGDRLNGRKSRLFAVACLRWMWRARCPEYPYPEAVSLAERFADGTVGVETVDAAERQMGARGGISSMWAVGEAKFAVLKRDGSDAASRTVWVGNFFHGLLADERAYFAKGIYDIEQPTPEALAARAAGRRAFAELLRDVAGDPGRPPVLTALCRTSEVLSLARSIYGGRLFSRLPELADLLEAAGCADAAVVAHCRHAGPHVRGCWVLDLILDGESLAVPAMPTS